MDALRMHGVSRRFEAPTGAVAAFGPVDGALPAGGRAIVTGPSGAGKSSLLAVVGLLDGGFQGQVEVLGQDVRRLSTRQAAAWRLRRIGHAFQDMHLVPSLGALENVMLPARAAGTSADAARRDATRLLEAAGLGGRLQHRPATLSGGERRRVVVARALVNSPELLLLDEPASGLDEVSAQAVRDLVRAAWEDGAAVIEACHQQRLLPHADVHWDLGPGPGTGAAGPA